MMYPVVDQNKILIPCLFNEENSPEFNLATQKYDDYKLSSYCIFESVQRIRHERIYIFNFLPLGFYYLLLKIIETKK